MPYRLEYSPEAAVHLQIFTARERGIVLAAVAAQLVHEPAVATRNRKPMLPNPIAMWERRASNLRVCYVVEEQPEPVVVINIVGVKRRNRVETGGERVDL